jgi:hypothetical protein
VATSDARKARAWQPYCAVLKRVTFPHKSVVSSLVGAGSWDVHRRAARIYVERGRKGVERSRRAVQKYSALADTDIAATTRHRSGRGSTPHGLPLFLFLPCPFVLLIPLCAAGVHLRLSRGVAWRDYDVDGHVEDAVQLAVCRVDCLLRHFLGSHE